MTSTDTAPSTSLMAGARRAHTLAQLAHWQAYERVRQGGQWNMFDPRARKATRLSDEHFLYVMLNYITLRDAAIARAKNNTG